RAPRRAHPDQVAAARSGRAGGRAERPRGAPYRHADLSRLRRGTAQPPRRMVQGALRADRRVQCADPDPPASERRREIISGAADAAPWPGAPPALAPPYESLLALRRQAVPLAPETRQDLLLHRREARPGDRRGGTGSRCRRLLSRRGRRGEQQRGRGRSREPRESPGTAWVTHYF